ARTKRRVVLIKASVILAAHLDKVRSSAEVVERDRHHDWNFRAPRAAVESPAIMGKARAIRKAGGRNAVGDVVETDDEHRGRVRRRENRLARNRDTPHPGPLPSEWRRTHRPQGTPPRARAGAGPRR